MKTIEEVSRAIRRGRKSARLYAGNTTGYASESEASRALVEILLFHSEGDFGMTDALVRQSALNRDKWDRPQAGTTWGQALIEDTWRWMQSGYPKQRHTKAEPAA
jgi:putative DNA primase/helicase